MRLAKNKSLIFKSDAKSKYTPNQAPELADLKGVTIPVRLNGPFDAPSWQIDWSAAAKDALKSKVGEELKGKAEDKLKQSLEKSGLGSKLEEKVDTKKAKDALKGLLGR